MRWKMKETTLGFKSIVRPYTAFLMGAWLIIAIPSGFGEGEEAAVAQSSAKVNDEAAFISTDAVHAQLDNDLQPKENFFDRNVFEPIDTFKKELDDKSGLKIGGDYNALYFGATDSLGDKSSGSGVFRLYGSWELVGKGTDNAGSLVYKIEHRHAYTDVAPQDFGLELGYAGLVQSVFSKQGFRTTNLYWRQGLAESRVVTYIGFLDVTDFTDVYVLASPWTAFNNLVFATGCGTIGGLPDGALGGMAYAWLTDTIYGLVGVTDANANSSDIFQGFDTFFGDFETFKNVELGMTSAKEKLFLDNVHVTLWQIDASSLSGSPDGWGANFSTTTTVADKWLPFLRGGWSKDGGSLLEASVSTGFGYKSPGSSDLLALGLNWGRPNADTFGPGLDDQFTAELFYRWQTAQHLQLTPSIQLLANPALNPNEDLIALFGLRARLIF